MICSSVGRARKKGLFKIPQGINNYDLFEVQERLHSKLMRVGSIPTQPTYKGW